MRKNVEDPDVSETKAKKALQDQVASIAALRDTKTAAETDEADVAKEGDDVARRLRALDALKAPSKVARLRPVLEMEAAGVAVRLRDMGLAVDAIEAKVVLAEAERGRLDQAKVAAEQKVRDAHDRAKQGAEDPDDIRAYAMRKNASGLTKKLISTVAGFIGIGGGIAGTIAAFAAIGATTVVATPVGWALCGAAALIGLALAGRAFWHWFSKRHDRAKQQEGLTGAKAFFTALNPFRKVGTSERERLARRLWEYGVGRIGDAADKAKAKSTVEALGLKWDKLNMDTHEVASIKLIQDKMAS